MSTSPRRQARGSERRETIIDAALTLMVREGPHAVSHRRVATEADVPLAATTYYFTSRDELLALAGQRLADEWARHATTHAKELHDTCATTPAQAAEILTKVALPYGTELEIRAYYEHAVVLGRSDEEAHRRVSASNSYCAAINTALIKTKITMAEEVIIACIDGAVLLAMRDGLPIRERVHATLLELFVETGAHAPAHHTTTYP